MTSRKKLPSYGKVDITIYECTCLFVTGFCSNFIKIFALKCAIQYMLNFDFAASHFSVVPDYAAIVSKNRLVNS